MIYRDCYLYVQEDYSQKNKHYVIGCLHVVSCFHARIPAHVHARFYACMRAYMIVRMHGTGITTRASRRIRYVVLSWHVRMSFC